MCLDILPMEAELLHQVCQPIPDDQITSPEVQHHIDSMLKIYEGISAVGLAAPQVGLDLRLFVINIEEEAKRSDDSGLPMTVFINPEFEVIDEQRIADWEGCFSVYHQTTYGLLGQVSRFQTVAYRAFDREGQPFSGTFSGFKARVFQHEYDHLDGIRYPNRMSDNGKLCFYQEGKKDIKLRIRDMPLWLRTRKFSELVRLAKVLCRAPHRQISTKLHEQIARAVA